MKPQIVVFALACLLVVPALQADAVLDWNAAHLSAIRKGGPNPPRASRQIAMVNLAMYDAVNGITRTHRPYHVTDLGPTGASKEAAAATAARVVLESFYSSNATVMADITAAYAISLATVLDGQSKTDGIAWGTQVGNAILALRADDGSNGTSPYAPGNQPGRWRPTPPANAAALLPHWGDVKTFGIISSDIFTPHPPPRLDSSLYATELNQVKELGSATSSTRTANETEIARFWADGATTETPPGHWIHIAADVSVARGLTVDENARLFALLGIAVADGGIVCWNAKFKYDYWRPITAVWEAENDGNPATTGDPAWTPLIATPPFPEYTSGHSTFSRASATILSAFLGTDDVEFTTTSDGLADITRTYKSFSAAADEAVASRVYGGIHFMSACVAGQTSGHLVADFIFKNYLRPLTELSFTLINRVSNDVTLTLEGSPQKSYRIEASSDFSSWEHLVTVTAGHSGQITFTDTNAPSGKRFYRATEL